jgi:small subunit ribosomal protein S1
VNEPEQAQTEATPPTPPAAAAAPAPPTPAPAPGRPGQKPRFGPRPKSLKPASVPTLADEYRMPTPPKLHDLDAEIAGELEAAMGDFSSQELLAEAPAGPKTAAGAAESSRKKGKIVSIHGPDVFVDVPGGRSQGVLSLMQFPEGAPALGTEVEVQIEGYDRANGLLILTRKGAAVQADWASIAEGMTVEARVTGVNKGGLEVDVNGIRGFMPISQIELFRVENAEGYLNQRLLCMVVEVVPSERNLVVSRRALLDQEREQQREKLWAEIDEGQIRTGIVSSVRDFGAFVDLGGADGLLHVSEMSWTRVADPSAIVQPGQSVKVVVLRVDREKRKLSLGLKQLQNSPWDDVDQRFPHSTVAKGKVTRLMDFGAFVELEPGVEGLIHISELAPQKVWRVKDVVDVGQEVSVMILSIDKEKRRMSLSLKAALPKAEPKAAEEPEEEEEEIEVKPPPVRTTPLRGGLGS